MNSIVAQNILLIMGNDGRVKKKKGETSDMEEKKKIKAPTPPLEMLVSYILTLLYFKFFSLLFCTVLATGKIAPWANETNSACARTHTRRSFATLTIRMLSDHWQKPSHIDGGGSGGSSSSSKSDDDNNNNTSNNNNNVIALSPYEALWGLMKFFLMLSLR
jgi:hypothetical protein